MSKAKSAIARPAFFTPTQMDWTEERLAALDKVQLINLLANLQTQRGSGRVGDHTADDLESRIKARLPARAIAVRRKRARSEVLLEARVAQQLGALATELAARYDLSAETAIRASADTKGFRPQPLTDSKGHARAGNSVKSGAAAIDRYIACRVRDSLASLAYVLLADRPQETGRYVLLGTDDLLASDTPPNEFTPVAEQHGWSAGSRTRMRAAPMANFAEAAQRFEAMIAQVAPALA
jgi:hypothetical protein